MDANVMIENDWFLNLGIKNKSVEDIVNVTVYEKSRLIFYYYYSIILPNSFVIVQISACFAADI